MLPVLAVVLGGVGVLLLAGTVVLRDALRAAVLLSAAVVLFFGYRHVAILTHDLPIAGRPVQLVWLALGLGALLLAWRGGRPLRVATRALNALGLALVIVALVTIVPHELEQVGRGVPLAAPVPSLRPNAGADGRDIWYLVFDRYGSAESLRLNYGIEDELTPWLADRGFHVTPDAQANYPRTGLSIASVLHLDYLDTLPAGQTATLSLRDHAVGRFLTDHGYRYIHIGSQLRPDAHEPAGDGQSRRLGRQRLRSSSGRQLARRRVHRAVGGPAVRTDCDRSSGRGSPSEPLTRRGRSPGRSSSSPICSSLTHRTCSTPMARWSPTTSPPGDPRRKGTRRSSHS